LLLLLLLLLPPRTLRVVGVAERAEDCVHALAVWAAAILGKAQRARPRN